MNAMSLRRMVVMVALVCISAGLVQADKLGLQEKLSKEIKIQLNDVTIAEALEKIGQKAGVKFVLSDEAEWKLPYGEATRLSVVMDGPLAESMTEMLNAFFMRYAVGGEVITIYPRPELEHILGKPTAKQLELLKAIYTHAIGTYVRSPQNTISEALGEHVAVVPYSMLDEIDSVLHRLAGKVRVKPRPEHLSFELAGPMTVANMLEQIGELKWYLSGMDFPNKVTEIRVVSWADFIYAKLDQIVDISFKGEKAEVIIQRLANWTGMELIVDKEDPSWLDEEISVDMQNIKLQQAIRNIVTTVDGEVDIDIRDNIIRMQGPRHTQKVAAPVSRRRPTRPRTAASASEGYVGKISIPMDGGKYYIEFMLRESDLTEQLKKLRQEKMTEILGEPPKLTPAAKPRK